MEYEGVSHLSIQLPLPTSCVQFCPKCTWDGLEDQGRERGEGRRDGRALQLCSCGEAILHAGFRSARVGASGSFVFLFIAPHPCPVSKEA